jgi:spermidine/putrescine transport system substrate-binding protein
MKLFSTLLTVLLCGWLGSVHAADTVVVYNWTEYLPKEVLTQFTRETGIKVRYSTYDNNETMYTKLKTLNGKGYDIVVPSTYYVDRMRREGLIQKLDKTRLGNLSNLNPRLLDQPYDPGNQYSIPYLWGTSGIAVNSKQVDPKTITGWADLWNPAFKNKLLLIDDMREVFAVALKVLGHPTNSTAESEIQTAYEKLVQLKPNIRLFNADSPKDLFLAEEVAVGMLWNGEAYVANQQNPNIQFIFPREGGVIWIDNLVIPSGATNVEGAHTFINFILRPEIARQISEKVGYATPNEAALKQLPDKVRDNPIAYPRSDYLQKSEFQTDVGAAVTIYDKYWQRLKTAR